MKCNEIPYDMIRIYNIEPLHEVRDYDKLSNLIDNMSIYGWVGRPILIVDLGCEYKALTGSHRYAAAKRVLDEIPVYIIEYSIFEKIEDDTGYGYDDFIRDPESYYKHLREYDIIAYKLLAIEIELKS
jgi:hypothetical protein